MSHTTQEELIGQSKIGGLGGMLGGGSSGESGGSSGGGGGGGFLEIDSDQQIYGATFGNIPSNPNSGMGFPGMGGSNNTLLFIGVGALIVYLVMKKK